MKQLEDKIINKIFKFEAGNTGFYTLSRIFIFITGLFIIFFLMSIIFEIFLEQKSFDLLNFASENIEVIFKYLIDNLTVLVLETPKALLVIIIALIILFVYFNYKLTKNLKNILNKIKSIYKFYSGKL